jgi:hypothetical protein
MVNRMRRGNHHSDNQKFRSDLNRSESCEMSEWFLKIMRKIEDFQAEYEGSIPFTRSNDFNGLDDVGGRCYPFYSIRGDVQGNKK